MEKMSVIKIFVLVLLILTIGSVFAFQNKKVLSPDKKVLVVYFSATGNTKMVAEKLAKAANAHIYDIKPLNPYTKADLDWTNPNSRSSIEMKNRKSRPEIIDDKLTVNDYDVIFLGFPIWWYVAPTIVNTFLEKYDFSNKTIILFGTSGGSGFGKTVVYLKPSVARSTRLLHGKIFKPDVTVEELSEWVKQFR